MYPHGVGPPGMAPGMGPFYPPVQSYNYGQYPQPITYQIGPQSYPWRSVLWFLALIFFAWPMAYIAAVIYVSLAPFGACCNFMRIITDALLLAVQFPCLCTENMIQQVRFC